MRRLARYAADLVLAALILLLLLAGPAEATHAEVFEITGGTQEQQDIIREALEESAWDWTWGSEQYLQTNIYLTPEHPPFWGDGSLYAAGREGETAFPYSVGRAAGGVAYWPSGAVYIDSTIADPKMLRQIAMHEAAHARIMFVWFWDRPDGASMYDCYALNAWRDLIGAYGNLGIWTESPVESHAEWFRVTYLDTQLQINVYPQTNLPGPPGGTADVVAFHDEWCPTEQEPPVIEEPPEPPVTVWPDVWRDDLELQQASWWAIREGVFWGRLDNTFGPSEPVLMRHVALITARLGLASPPWRDAYAPATRGQVRDAIPGLTWKEERWDESLTRSQLMRLLFRAYEEVAPVQVMGAKLDQWLYNTQVTWSGVTRTPRLAGYGDLLIEQAYAYDVPIWLALGQCWRESQWGTTGLSIDHNCLWGVKDTSGKWGALRGTVAGFADYVSVPECVRAYYRLMDSPAYRGYIDAEDWARLLNKYDPQVSDGGAQHLRIVMIVKAWCEGHGIR